VSTVVEQSPTVPADPPAAGSRSGSLLRAELHRFRARRFIQVLLGLFVLGWLAAIAIALPQFGVPTDADRAEAQRIVEQFLADDAAFQEQCRNDPQLPDDVPVEDVCGPPLTAEDLRMEDFITQAPFDLESTAAGGALAFGAAAAVLAFLIGATWIGAEWSTRSIVALLFWVPRRMRVMGVKLGVLILASALLGVVAQVAWLAMAGILQTLVGNDEALPPGFWGDVFATQGRTVLLVVLAALGGFGLANLVRNTGAALGIGFVYFAIIETAVGAFRPTWQPWLLTSNAGGLVLPDGLTLFIWDESNVGPADSAVEYVVTNQQGAILLTAVVAVVVGIGVALFAQRDLH
jgi:hypothetical protein